MNLPSSVKQGQVARLIPVVSDTSREQRAISALLSVMSAVPEFGEKILEPLGEGIGKRTKINTYTEIILNNEDDEAKDRPDGLICLNRRGRDWQALVEGKIGKAPIKSEQIERYLKLAKGNNIDGLISISNEFAPRPHHFPYEISAAALKKVKLCHLSWTYILTEAVILHDNALIDDPEQAFILREFVRFLSHETVGVTGYTSMPRCWREVLGVIHSGGKLNKQNPDLISLVHGWHQELRDLTLQLSQYLSARVDVKLLRKFEKDSSLRVSHDVGVLCKTNSLAAQIKVPDTASEIKLVADIKSRVFRISMELEAPKDKKRRSARFGWLLRQLKEIEADDITVRIIWATKTTDKNVSLYDLRENVKTYSDKNSYPLPRAFEIILNHDCGGQKFSGRKTFITELESVVPHFYDAVGQHLVSWRPQPPKPKQSSDGDSARVREQDNIGNLDIEIGIPIFLKRNDADVKSKASNPIAHKSKGYSKLSRFKPYILG